MTSELAQLVTRAITEKSSLCQNRSYHLTKLGSAKKRLRLTLREKCPYLEFFWSVFSPNAEKYRPEKLRIQSLFKPTTVMINLIQ